MYRGKAHNLLLTSKYKYLKHYNVFPFKINIKWNPKFHNFSYSSQGQSHLYLYTKIQSKQHSFVTFIFVRQ